MVNKVKVSTKFIEYSMELAEDILGYNQCFGGDKEVKRKLKSHIKKCKELINEINIKSNKGDLNE